MNIYARSTLYEQTTILHVFSSFFWLKRIPIHQLKIYVITFLFTSTFMINVYNEHSLHLFVGWTCMNPLIWTNYISPICLPFFRSSRYQSTNQLEIYVWTFLSTSTFMIKAYNIHYTCWVNMNPIIWTTIFNLIDYLFLGLTDTNPPTQSLCFNVPFHLYIHDQGLQQTFATVTCWVNMYEPLIWTNNYISPILLPFLAQIPIHQLKICFNVPFHLYIHDHRLQQTFTTLVGWTCMNPLIWTNNYI